MKKLKKKYKRPKILWSKERIEREKELSKKFGLRKSREIWKAETLLRKYRRLARKLATIKDERVEKELIEKLSRLGILEKNATLDNVLSLSVEDILERRLETVVNRLGLANTPLQARQRIVHGYIAIGDRKITYPSYMVSKDEEKKIKLISPKKTSTVKK